MRRNVVCNISVRSSRFATPLFIIENSRVLLKLVSSRFVKESSVCVSCTYVTAAGLVTPPLLFLSCAVAIVCGPRRIRHSFHGHPSYQCYFLPIHGVWVC